MKLKKPGLKGLNGKQFLVDHGEKLMLGLVAVLGLAALGLSRWAPYNDKTPYGLTQAVEEAKQQHATSTWPEAEQQKFAKDENIQQKAEELLAALDDSRYAFGRTLPEVFWPVIPQQKPIEEPRWFAVENLVADFGTLLYEKAPDYDELYASLEEEAEAAEEEKPSTGPRGRRGSDFGPAGPRTGLPGTFGLGEEGYENGYLPPEGMAGVQGGARGRGARGAGPGAARGGPGGAHAGPGMDMTGGMEMLDMYGEYGEGLGYGMAGPVEAEGKRYVAVRGVFPIQQQERELAQALGARSVAQVAHQLQFADFELERQRAVQGPDPWAGEWEKVDIEVAQDVLDDQARFDLDVVDPTVTNNVFTMPLPGRVAGTWNEDNASHPSLEKFAETDPTAKRQQEWIQARIAEYAALMEEQSKDQVEIGGFANQTYNAAAAGREMMMDTSYMNNLYGQAMQQPGTEGMQLTQEDIKSMLSASGTYLLFRYLDFDVQPGNAYRYRVRLKLVNPSYGLDIGEVERADVAEGQTRDTEWSKPTDPVIAPKDTRHFVVDVEPPRTRQADRAWFDLFQWSQEFGTIVNKVLPVEPGQFIGGADKAQVIDPAAQTFEEQEFTFTSGDMLVDIDRNDMYLASRAELSPPAKFKVPSQVLVVNEWGGLEVQDPLNTAGNRREWHEFIDEIEAEYEYLRAPPPAATGEEGMEFDPYSAEMGEGMGYPGMMGRTASPLRRGGRGRGGSQGAPGGAHAGGGGNPLGGMVPPGGASTRRRR